MVYLPKIIYNKLIQQTRLLPYCGFYQVLQSISILKIAGMIIFSIHRYGDSLIKVYFSQVTVAKKRMHPVKVDTANDSYFNFIPD